MHFLNIAVEPLVIAKLHENVINVVYVSFGATSRSNYLFNISLMLNLPLIFFFFFFSNIQISLSPYKASEFSFIPL